MARQKEEDDYYGGSDLLTPSQKIAETYRLAPGGAADVGSNLSADVATMAAANRLNNPLLASRDAGLAPAATEVAPVFTGPNPFTRVPLITPPVPISSMPIAQQMAWQDRAIKETADQRALEKQMLDIQIARRQEEQGMEAFKQGQALIARSGELNPGDIKNYPILRAKLAREHPLGAVAPEVSAALSQLDAAYENTLRTEMDITKAEEANRRIEERGRLSDARKTAADLGPEALARFSEREKRSPDEAITGVMQEAAKIKQANVTERLRAVGKTEEEIARYQTPEGFLFNAAEVEAGRGMTPKQQADQLLNVISVLEKRRKDTMYTGATPDEKAELEANLKGAWAQYNTIQDRGRIGVQGMPGGGEVTAREENRYRAMRPTIAGPAQQQQPPQQQQPVTAQAAPVVAPTRRAYYTPAPAAGQPSPTPQSVVREKRKINPETGQTIVLRNGKWVDPVTGKEI